MADLPSRTDLFQVGRRSLITTPGLRVNPKSVDVEGSDINVLLGAMSLMGEEIVSSVAVCMRGLFVETAEGDRLDRVAFDRYQLTRLPAAPATVTLTLTRPNASFGSFTYGAGSRVQTPSGTVFATDLDTVFGAADLTKTVTATALVAGPDGNVPAESITQFVDQPADASLTSTNEDIGTPGFADFIPGGAAGGVDAETDPEFRARILDFFPTVRRGTIGAIEFGARLVPGVAVARAIEIENLIGGQPIPACLVQLIVADRNGGFSQAMLQAVRDILIQFRAAGIPVQVTGGVVANQLVQWRIAFVSGFNQQKVQDEVRAVTSAVAQFLRPGEILYKSALIAAARTVPGAVIDANSLVAPLGDTVPADLTQLLRIPSENVSFI